MIDEIGGVDADVEVVALLDAEGPGKGGVEGELLGADDGVAAGVSPLAGLRRGIGLGIEKVAV